MIAGAELAHRTDSARVADLRRRVRDAMEVPPVRWECPASIDQSHMAELLPVRKALAVALKLSHMHVSRARRTIPGGIRVHS